MLHCLKTLTPYILLSTLIATVTVTTGCGGNTKPQPPSAKTQAAPPENPAGNASADSAAPDSPSEPVIQDPQAAATAALEAKMLSKAERAFRAGRMTEPAHDNAYDTFHSVLLLNPNNSQARAGVQAILIRYADLIRRALAEQDYYNAEILVNRAQIYYPGNALLLDLKKELTVAREKEDEQMLTTPPTDLAIVDYPLPSGALSRRSSTVSGYLARIAQRLKENGESVMIHARSDAEGRWIYKQLNDAVPGFRVRGDIKLGRAAKIVILPPLQ